MTPLSDSQITATLAGLPGWVRDGDTLVRRWRFPSFAEAIAFISDACEPIDAANHHPEWRNVYDRVEARLTTHEAGNRITARDTALAKLLEHLARGRTVEP